MWRVNFALLKTILCISLNVGSAFNVVNSSFVLTFLVMKLLSMRCVNNVFVVFLLENSGDQWL